MITKHEERNSGSVLFLSNGGISGMTLSGSVLEGSSPVWEAERGNDL